jgi:hypothetical protein
MLRAAFAVYTAANTENTGSAETATNDYLKSVKNVSISFCTDPSWQSVLLDVSVSISSSTLILTRTCRCDGGN